jgi:hypothetical protein
MTKKLEGYFLNIVYSFGYLNFGHWNLFVICDL